MKWLLGMYVTVIAIIIVAMWSFFAPAPVVKFALFIIPTVSIAGVVYNNKQGDKKK